ncbi:terminal beta-(1-_2)-arabinofuranosyltransferase [Streptomyces durmitorensis]|uniref:Terminal beta-(1->2)-arabinofuranosyltransferase C-terminal domain-containing protein n=1 Tax=Streptomyces durmitorensis TaxID=319947 RepID=A0ABY4Q048_9ACTN|nr:hypothetical protein [Streptomyces durmitorensis]UQT58468.1 hypothetical protein M4V62_27215 [Streptomyces durmitorensis]
MTSTHLSLREPDAVLGLLNSRRSAGRSLRRGVLCLLPALAIAFAGFHRRWMSDDGHIYVRTVRQILAGNGPVFNAGERAESSTGTLWQWLLVLAGLPGLDIARAAMYGGLLLTAAGFALASLGALRLYADRAVLPLGCLVLLALPPVWDFATSGLETGLATCWIAGAWLLLVTRAPSLATCVVIGLGPLVRPDLALVSAVFLGAQWLMVRPSRRAALGGLGAALALPVAYEIFRVGYYGQLMPLPGVTKEASQSLWGRGFDYLADFAGPYFLWVPALFLLTALLPSAAGRRAAAPLVPALAPVVAGLLCWVYVIKVGGDFMHGRMFLPGLLLMLLPVFLVPLTRAWTIAAVGVGIWAVACASLLRIPYEGRIGPGGVADERGVYVRQNAAPHPLHHDFAGYPSNVTYARLVREADRAGTPSLFLARTPAGANSPTVTGVFSTLGFSGTVVPLDGAALDPIGLAYPLAAHSERIADGRVGHDKRLPDTWIFADRGHGPLPDGLDPAGVAAARRALGCGPLAELRAATRDPMTPGRFLRNVTGVWERTSFRFPNDPVRAERELCGARQPNRQPKALSPS